MGTGGKSWLGRIPHINGGVFSESAAPALTASEVSTLRDVAGMEWGHLEPSIFGTLFERVIDASKRSQLGAHYTPLQDILDVVLPVVIAPLRAEWEALRAELSPVIAEAQRLRQEERGRSLFERAQGRACGAPGRGGQRPHPGLSAAALSGHGARPGDGVGQLPLRDAAPAARPGGRGAGHVARAGPALGQSVTAATYPPLVGPEQMRGIELSSYAHEIASMVLWIGYLQWLAEHGEPFTRSPVLSALRGLENRDAVLDGDQPAEWPAAEFIVGNPPFVGNTRMRQMLGDDIHRDAAGGLQPGGCRASPTWWRTGSRQARAQIEAGVTRRAGLIATNSIRGGANAEVLARILTTGGIFMAWPDRAWVQDGAAVRVSIVGFDGGVQPDKTRLRHQGDEDDLAQRTTVSEAVGVIHADLTSGPDLRQARRLRENAGRSFEGVKPAGKFDLPGAEARSWLDLPNPSGVSNADVLKPYIGGEDITDGSKDRWTVDFNQMSLRRPSSTAADEACAGEGQAEA